MSRSEGRGRVLGSTVRAGVPPKEGMSELRKKIEREKGQMTTKKKKDQKRRRERGTGG